MPAGVVKGKIQEIKDSDADYELLNSAQLVGTHINMIPFQSAVQGPRHFYGARFNNQAQPLLNREAPLVQSLDPNSHEGKSFDELLGPGLGAVFSKHDGEVKHIDKDKLVLSTKEGDVIHDLYDNFPFNTKSGIHNEPSVKVGDKVKKGDVLAGSNYTDKNGVAALGLNARIALVPYKGFSMDDAIVISQAFAKRLTSEHTETHEQEYDRQVKAGLNHFRSLFPERFKKAQLANLDEHGVAKVGTILQQGDPLILATKPRSISSSGANVGKLTKSLSQIRSDASQVWDNEYPGEVLNTERGKNGVKVITRGFAETKNGDKVVLRSGSKGIVSKIIPDDQMPHTADGNPIEILLNHLSIPSRTNDSLVYEILAGKAAKTRGKNSKFTGFNKPGEKWYDIITKELEDTGHSDVEKLFDPIENRFLDNPVTVGNAYMMKLHHVAACFDEETEVLTSKGWKYWPEVTMEDELATSDTKGQTLFFEKPLHVMSYDYNGLLYGFDGTYINYLVTPNHNMWTKPYYAEGHSNRFSFRQAQDIHGRRWMVKQFGMRCRSPKHPGSITIEDVSYDWDDFAEMVGWWVTEGCVNSSNNGIVIYQVQSANPKKVDRIEALLRRMPIKWSYYRAYGEIKGFSIASKSLAKYFSNYGKQCQFKTVPREIIEGPHSGLQRCLESMNLGDGNFNKCPSGKPGAGNWRMNVTSKQLVDDYQEISIRLGYGSNINKTILENSKKHIENPHYLPSWTASCSKQRTNSMLDGDRNKQNYYQKPYKGKVYCAEMRTGMLYVRREGKPLLTGNSKRSGRSQGSYDLFQQPTKGGGEGAQAKRLGGLDTAAMISSGAYANLREASTLRGQMNDEYWRALRTGLTPKKPGIPFSWSKTLETMKGAGIHPRQVRPGVLRLTPMTDKDTDEHGAVEIKNGEMLDLNTLQPVKGGLFDPTLVGTNKWGKITLPFHVPNPAYEDSIRILLGLKKKEMEAIMSGKMELPDRLR